MHLQRAIADQLRAALDQPGSAVILYGPRQAGKTTLVRQLLSERPDAVSFTGDDLHTQTLLARHELEHLKRIVGKATTVFIDEAQRIENIGLTLKLLVDHLPVTVIASGSASFELADRLNEPLTGRARTFHLFPLAWSEVAETYRLTDPETALEEMLRFGMYPRVHTLESDREKEEYLYEYLNSYLYRDLLEFEQVKKPRKVVDLLVLLAHQVGREVAVAELAAGLGIGQKTVESYLDILEKMFVLVNVRGFSRNLRKEVTKTSRYYFVDLGLRNALIRSFTPLSLRSDAGELFENWFVMERRKRDSIRRLFTGFHFWRTYDRKEIDLVEERDGGLAGYECKWSQPSRTRPPKDWEEAYPQAGYHVVSRENWREFLEG
ncbi:MAG TPA: ATP-binding protein [Thermodesulfobacteriota bacterium]|nr:ATP-binding protein [Thermodesulfobacteriota bacterium]